ncbi:MAG TPA: hypothetical protein VG870_08210 [Chitinophagaceae bacterium]|nr:hypothetical protein [Chitinophagaceae bacterium]
MANPLNSSDEMVRSILLAYKASYRGLSPSTRWLSLVMFVNRSGGLPEQAADCPVRDGPGWPGYTGWGRCPPRD